MLALLVAQMELVEAFDLVHPNECELSLVLNTNDPFPQEVKNMEGFEIKKIPFISQTFINRIYKLRTLLINKKVREEISRLMMDPKGIMGKLKDINTTLNEELFKNYAPQNIEENFHNKLLNKVSNFNKRNTTKQILVVDLPRDKLVQAYHSANLFVFPSYVEYSPLVLFEAAASGTPFLSSEAGNSRELVEWLGGGFVMNTPQDDNGYCVISPKELASEINILINQKKLLLSMGERMKKIWQDNYTWDEVVKKYVNIINLI